MEVILKPRSQTIAQLIEDCVDEKIPFSGPGSLCEAVARMGYKTTSLYEMVLAAERNRHAHESYATQI